MAMRVSRKKFLGVDEVPKQSFEDIAAKMALDFETDVFRRLKELGLKRKDLAYLLGVSPAAVSKMLSENSNMTLKSMAKIASALKSVVSPIRLQGVCEVSYVDLDDAGAAGIFAEGDREPGFSMGRAADDKLLTSKRVNVSAARVKEAQINPLRGLAA